MRLTTSICIAFGMTLFAVPAYAMHHKTKIKCHHACSVTAPRPAAVVKQDNAPHRVCDWIGPGGRAVYRCTTVEAAPPPLVVSQDTTPPHRTCGWLPPAGPRALYACR
jgi:hypothetical protein